MLQMSIRKIMQMRLSSNLLPMHVRVIDGAKQLSVVNNNQVYLGAGNSAVRDKSVGVDVGRQTNNGGNGCGRSALFVRRIYTLSLHSIFIKTIVIT